MVRVIAVHHFDNQVIQTTEEPVAVATASHDRLLVALPHHVIEVRSLQSNGEVHYSFPTVDRVAFLSYCSTGT